MFDVDWRGNNISMAYTKDQHTIKCTPEETLRRIGGYTELIDSLDGHVDNRPEIMLFGDDDLLKVTKMFSADQQPYLAAALGNFIASSASSNLKIVPQGSHFWDQSLGRLVTPISTLSKLRAFWVKHHQVRYQTTLKRSDLIEVEVKMGTNKWNLVEVLRSFFWMGKPEQTISDQTEEQDKELSNMPEPRERFKCHAERNWEDSAHLNQATVWFSDEEDQQQDEQQPQDEQLPQDAQQQPQDAQQQVQAQEPVDQEQKTTLQTSRLNTGATSSSTWFGSVVGRQPRQLPKLSGFAATAQVYKQTHEQESLNRSLRSTKKRGG